MYIPPNSYKKEDLGPLLITDNDHKIAAILAVSSNHTVVVPGYFIGSKHIVDQLSQKDYYDFDRMQEQDYGDIGDFVRGGVGAGNDVDAGYEVDAGYDVEADYGVEAGYGVEVAEGGLHIDEGLTGKAAVEGAGGGSYRAGWVHPYPKHPVVGHLALRAYEHILQNLPTLLDLPHNEIPPGVSLSMSGSLVGAGLASSIALSEFKHPPFKTGVTVEATTWVPDLGKQKQVTFNVELKSLALVTPLVNWCFDPLGGYDFSVDQQGTGAGWLLPPVPQLPHPTAANTEPEGGPYLLPAPTLPTLLRLRSALFKSPEDYIDPFASPLFFLQTPGMDVGRDALAKLWVSLWEQVQRPTRPDIITIEGTKRRTVGRRWPPTWGKLHVDGLIECRRGGLPRRGRIRVIVPGEGEAEDGGGAVWGYESFPPGRKSTFDSIIPDPKKPDIISEYAEYSQDNTPVEKYKHSAHTTSLLKNPSLLLSRLTSYPLSTRSAGWWLVGQAGGFVCGIERAWRSVVSADPDLRRALEIEKSERLAKRMEVIGSGEEGGLGRKKGKKGKVGKKKKREDVVEVDEEVLSLLEVIGDSGGRDLYGGGEEDMGKRMELEEDAVVRLGRWVAEVGQLP